MNGISNSLPKVGQRFFSMNGESVYQALTADGIPDPHRYYRPTGWELIDVRNLPQRPDLQDEVEAGDRNKHFDRIAAAIRDGHFNPKPKAQVTALVQPLKERAA